MARNRLEKKTGVPQIYFTGCGGNVTVEKHHDGTRAARSQLASRRHEAKSRSSAAQPATSVGVVSLKPTDIARKSSPNSSLVCIAGYGECGVWYYGLDHIFTNRGRYEQTGSLAGSCQTEIESALRKVLAR